MNVRFIHITPETEKHIAYCARVSSPNQDNPEHSKLLEYCIKNKHWSIFEMGTLCLEIKTSRAIAQQILRHRSFHFQEFSQRYAEVQDFEFYSPRRQDVKNRQNSIDDFSEEIENWFLDAQSQIIVLASDLYHEAISKQIAKESARFLLPLNTQTKLYMHGSIRDWIHYLSVRTDNSTQLEHREIALECKKIFIEQLPIVSKALEWS